MAEKNKFISYKVLGDYFLQDFGEDKNHSHKISVYLGIKISLLGCVVFLTALSHDKFDARTIFRIYSFTLFSYLFTYFFSIWFNELIRIRYFLLSQVAYDILYTGALIFYTGRHNSVFVFLFPITIIYAAILLGKRASLLTAFASGLFFSSLSEFELSDPRSFEAYFHSIAYIVTAVLTGTLIEEAQKNRQAAIKHEKSLNALQKFNDIIIKNMNAGLALVDENFKILDTNRLLDTWFQNDRKKMQAWINKNLKNLNISSSEESEGQALLKIPYDQVTISVQVTKINFIDQIEGSKFAYFFYDMTEVLKLEKQNALNERLASVGQLAAGIAHEIRNPLAGISGAAEFLSTADFNLGKQEGKLLKNIVKESDRLNRLIENFLNYSKPNRSQYRKVNLGIVFQEIIQMVRSKRGSESDIHYELKIPENLEVSIPADIIKQAIINIILNAQHALNQKNAPKDKRIVCTANQTAEYTEIKISNNGPMIPDKKKEKIFEPFFTSKISGTGLGLSTAYSNLRESGCDIKLTHSTKEQTEFLIRIPQLENSKSDEGKMVS